jgi:DNA repair protein RadC
MFIRLGRKIKITKSEDVYSLISSIIKKQQPIDRDKEFFIVIGLKTSGYIKYVDIVSIGTLKGTLACGREVFKGAIQKSAATIILSHNHPSGNNKPSQSDIDLTERMVEIGNLMDIGVIDHVIVTTDQGYYSFADEGKINTGRNVESYLK